MKKELIFSSLLAVMIAVIGLSNLAFKKDIKETKGVDVVPTMEDVITKDSSWCPTFQLIFNDLKNDIYGAISLIDFSIFLLKSLYTTFSSSVKFAFSSYIGRTI